jgi:small subunit ribosomal protein S6e
MKIVYSDKKSGKTAQAELAKESEPILIGKKIGDVIEGNVIKLDGFKLQITGLSDNTGSPSRKEIEGTRKARPLLGSGPGIRSAKHGFRSRRLIRGSTISADTVQINTVITEYGSASMESIFKPKEKKEE